ncbi:MAG TPA: VOC family protein, partial [Roseateles sp.]|nr:VOC family protein [Roseateles sp.]
VNPAAPTTFDHTAFAGSDARAVAAHLTALGVRFHESRSAVTGQHQFFLQDPAGNGVEINFPF